VLEYTRLSLKALFNVSVAGCLGYDVLVITDIVELMYTQFQLLVVMSYHSYLFFPAHHNLNNQQLKHRNKQAVVVASTS
jgi:hypothetical protein